MSMYKCIPAVKKKCGIQCDGTYNGTDCECAKLNMAYLPPTVRDELTAYRATGFTPEEIAAVMALAEKMNVVDLVRENLRISNSLRHSEAQVTTLQADAEMMEHEIQRLSNTLTMVINTKDQYAAENERLMAERDFAIGFVRKNCETCKHSDLPELSTLQGLPRYSLQQMEMVRIGGQP